jgi:hypothetical protein
MKITWVPLLIFIFFLYLYNISPTNYVSSDSTPARILPFNLLSGRGIFFDDYISILPSNIYFIQPFNGHYISSYSMLPGIIVLPLYIPFYFYLTSHHIATPMNFFITSFSAERVASSVIASLTSVLLFILFKRLTKRLSVAVLFTLIYSFCTQAFSIDSQALWSHGTAALFMVLSQLMLLRGISKDKPRESNLLWGLIFALLAVFTRYTFIIYFLLTAFLVTHESRRFKKAFFWCALFGLVSFFMFNNYLYGALIGTKAAPLSQWTPGGIISGLMGILFSPGRGMLFYTPLFFIALFPLPFLKKVKSLPPEQMKIIRLNYLWLVGSILLYSTWKIWWGGWGWGDRFLADGAVSAVILLYFILLIYKYMWLKMLVVVLVSYSFLIQVIGLYSFPRSDWDSYPRNVNLYPDRLWRLKDNPISRSLKVGPGFVNMHSIFKYIEKPNSYH